MNFTCENADEEQIKKQVNKEKKYLENNFKPNKNQLLQKYKKSIHPKNGGIHEINSSVHEKQFFRIFFIINCNCKKKRKCEKRMEIFGQRKRKLIVKITPHMKVGELQYEFKNQFGVTIRIFHKLQNVPSDVKLETISESNQELIFDGENTIG